MREGKRGDEPDGPSLSATATAVAAFSVPDNVLEIQENFENYVDKKDTTWSCLEGLKAHAKLVSLGETIDAFANMDTDQVELCRFLYKLHFQQLLLLERHA